MNIFIIIKIDRYGAKLNLVITMDNLDTNYLITDTRSSLPQRASCHPKKETPVWSSGAEHAVKSKILPPTTLMASIPEAIPRCPE